MTELFVSYLPPQMELINVASEVGFAASGEDFIIEPWNVL